MQNISTREWLAGVSVGTALFLLVAGGCLLRVRDSAAVAAGNTIQPIDPNGAVPPAVVIAAAAGDGKKGSGSVPPKASPPPKATATPTPSPAPPKKEETEELVVYVTGAVKNPGVYHLALNARVYQAIDAAGGFAANAQQDALNLAEKLRDADQIRVPTHEDVAKSNPSTEETIIPSTRGQAISSKEERSTPTTLISSGAPSFPPRRSSSSGSRSSSGAGASRSRRSSGGASSSGTKFHNPGDGMVHLNSANAAQLQRLPGVGKAIPSRMYCC